jgi:predicted site-specific integrase-resolvase
VNLKQRAESQGIHHHTAHRWLDHARPIPAERVGPRTLRVHPNRADPRAPAGFGLHDPASSHAQSADLRRQVAHLTERRLTAAKATKAPAPAVRMQAEVGRYMRGASRKLQRLVWAPDGGTMVAVGRDRPMPQ